jgi:hypothetical protein
VFDAEGSGEDVAPVQALDRRRWAVAAAADGRLDLALALARSTLPIDPSPSDLVWLAAFQVLAGHHADAHDVVVAHGEVAVAEVADDDDAAFLRLVDTAARAHDDDHAWRRLQRLGAEDAPEHAWKPLAGRLLLAVAVERDERTVADDTAIALWLEHVAIGRPIAQMPSDLRRHGAAAWMRRRPRPGLLAQGTSRALGHHVRSTLRGFDSWGPFPEHGDDDVIATAAALAASDGRLLLETADVGLGTPALTTALERFRRPTDVLRRPAAANTLGIALLLLSITFAPPLLLLALPLAVVFLTQVRLPPLTLAESRAVLETQTFGVHPADGTLARDRPLPGAVRSAFVIGSVACLGILVNARTQGGEPVLGTLPGPLLAAVVLSAVFFGGYAVVEVRARARIREGLLDEVRAKRASALARPTVDALAGHIERGPLAAALAERLPTLPGHAPDLPGLRTRALLAGRRDGRPERLLVVVGDDQQTIVVTQRSWPVTRPWSPPAGEGAH